MDTHREEKVQDLFTPPTLSYQFSGFLTFLVAFFKNHATKTVNLDKKRKTLNDVNSKYCTKQKSQRHQISPLSTTT